MKDIQVLDCTLRDGGRIIDCKFQNDEIIGIGKGLVDAGIDIIEIGFLRDLDKYNENSTFFSCCADADYFINKIELNHISNCKYVLFVDHGMYDISKLADKSNTAVTGIRFGFTKKDFDQKLQKIIDEMKYIKYLGYDLYIQDVNTNGYDEDELKEVINCANTIQPVSFGMVDTYGSMYLDDLEKLWTHIDSNLDKSIAVDFHSHNNMQMSFALCQRIIGLSRNNRKLIIDSTLEGMGKAAGNLNTELMVDYLSRKKNCDYNTDKVLDAIDRYIFKYKENNQWGYSIPAFLSGVFSAHPNNIIYLTEKYRLNNKDIKYILSGISKDKRQRYDYDNIAEVYKSYIANNIDDSKSFNKLFKQLNGKDILIIAPGNSVAHYTDDILEYLDLNSPVVISVNYIPSSIPVDYTFFANTIHWEKMNGFVDKEKCILTSNIHEDIEGVNMFDYSGLLQPDSELGDNSTIMLLYLLKRFAVQSIRLAGFDGLRQGKENYVQESTPNIKKNMEFKHINAEIKRLFLQFKERTDLSIDVGFITPSLYE